MTTQQSTSARAFKKPVTKEQSSEFFDCIFKYGFSINSVSEILLSAGASMQMGTLLRAAAREWVLMTACTETAKEYFVLSLEYRFGNMRQWDYFRYILFQKSKLVFYFDITGLFQNPFK